MAVPWPMPLPAPAIVTPPAPPAPSPSSARIMLNAVLGSWLIASASGLLVLWVSSV